VSCDCDWCRSLFCDSHREKCVARNYDNLPHFNWSNANQTQIEWFNANTVYTLFPRPKQAHSVRTWVITEPKRCVGLVDYYGTSTEETRLGGSSRCLFQDVNEPHSHFSLTFLLQSLDRATSKKASPNSATPSNDTKPLASLIYSQPGHRQLQRRHETQTWWKPCWRKMNRAKVTFAATIDKDEPSCTSDPPGKTPTTKPTICGTWCGIYKRPLLVPNENRWLSMMEKTGKKETTTTNHSKR